MLGRCWLDVGPPSTTLTQHRDSTGLMYRVWWDCALADIQTDILLTEKKSLQTYFIEMKEIYVHVYTRLLIC